MTTAKDAAPAWRRDLAAALAAVLACLAFNAASGFRSLSDFGGDNDSLLRLVEVRDLLAGQGWFDLHQYRMGLEGGFVMHWSRLVDAPIAAIILAVSALTGSQAVGETVAQVLWPVLLLGLTALFLLRAARRFGGPGAVLPAVVIGVAALYFIGIYSPGSLDHHNVQLMLATASLAFLLDSTQSRPAAILSGGSAALMLAVGMETAPYVAAIGLCVAALYGFGNASERPVARDFGLGLAGVSALAFISTVSPSAWGLAQCDAFSVVQFVLGTLAGGGLAVVASSDAASRSRARRLTALAALGLAVAAVALARFPECLAAPYAGLDPRLKEMWLDHIEEAQSLFQLLKDSPASVVARYATPLLALALLAVRVRRGGWRREDSIVGAMLAMAFLVSVWQVRGSNFSIAFAIIPLSAWIAGWRERALAVPKRSVQLRMAAVWLVSLNASWTGAAAAASLALEGSEKANEQAAVAETACERTEDFNVLAQLPPSRVLAISNLGSPILVYSGHSVFAGPYHRNVAGDLLALDVFMGPESAAKALVERHHVGLVALCRGSAESKLIAEKAPDGFLAGLIRGEVPAWLQPVAGTKAQPLQVFTVLPAE